MKRYTSLWSFLTMLFTIIIAIFACNAFAGPSVDLGPPPSPDYTASPVFLDNELQIDLFATHLTTNLASADGWGGGIGLTYFFTQELGLGVEGAYHDGDTWSTAANIYMRAPIEPLSIAPYVYGGIGGTFVDIGAIDTDDFGYHLGGGLDWRFTDTIGSFADWRYSWHDDIPDSQSVRVGLRFTF